MNGRDLVRVRSLAVNFYVLKDHDGLYLIDAGFIGGRRQLARALKENGWENEKIIGIILTHGHIDHIFNVGALAAETGAWIAAPALDEAHYHGAGEYSGLSCVIGVLEGIARKLPGFQPFTPHRILSDGDQLDIWGGLRVVHLPGHTRGHSGLYSEEKKLLFCGDLFASFKGFSHFPPSLFNHNDEEVFKSVAQVLELDLVGILPKHADDVSPELHLSRLQVLSGF